MGLLTNLLAGWKFEEATSSATWADVLGSSPLSATGTITSVAGILGNAASGFSVSDYLSMTTLPVTGAPFSVSLWFYVTSTAGLQYFWTQTTTGNAIQLLRMLNNRGSVSLVFSADGSNLLSTTLTPTLNTWHHLAATQDSPNGAKLYYDGVYKATAAISYGGLTPASTGVGILPTTSPSSPLLGRIDSLYLWSRVLTDGGVSTGQTAGGEIAQLYGGGAGLDYPFTTPGSLAVTLGSLSPSLTGKEVLSGLLAATLSGLSPLATGKERLSGASSRTLASLLASSAGKEVLAGLTAATLGGVIPTATGKEIVSGLLGKILDPATLLASGPGEGLRGSLAATLGNLALLATGSMTPLVVPGSGGGPAVGGWERNKDYVGPRPRDARQEALKMKRRDAAVALALMLMED